MLGVWNEYESDISSSSRTTGGEKIVRSLLNKKDEDLKWGLNNNATRLISDGANIAVELLAANCSEMPKLLELVLNIWVDKLLYAAT